MGWMSAICDAHKKKVGVELLYYSVQFGDQTSWRQDAVEKASTQQRESSGPWLSSCSWRSDELERRCWNENMSQWGWAPRSPVEQHRRTGKEMRLWPIEWGSICCSSVRSPTPSHTQPFNKVRGIFFLRTVSLVFIVSSLWLCMHLHMSMQQHYI